MRIANFLVNVRRRSLIVGALYGVIAISCTQVPLLNYLGYEFSALMAVIASIIAGLETMYALRSVYAVPPLMKAGVPPDPWRVFRRTVIEHEVHLLIPLTILLANAFFVRNCSIIQGVGFYMLLPIVSVWFSSALGFFCAVHYRHARSVWFLIAVATLAYNVALGYWTPAIFSYNFFYGFFPGFSYDEVLQLNATLIWFRLVTVLAGGGLAWMAGIVIEVSAPGDAVWQKGWALLKALIRPSRRVVSGLACVVFGLAYLFRCPLGFESTASFIQHTLGGKFQTEHCTIYYSPSSYSDEEIRWIAAEHEFRLHQIRSAFILQDKGTIESYVYPSAEVKQRLIGAGSTNFAKPWSGQIHITKQTLETTLKHELVHVVAAPFGFPIIGASLSMGLVEGLAVAIDEEWGNRTLHQYAAALRKEGLFPDIKRLMTPAGFASQSTAVSYVLAGSFCRYLIDRYGVRKITQLYRNVDYAAVYGRPLEGMIAEWGNYLDRVSVNPHDRDAIDAFFRRPPIFRKVCARVTAERNAEAATLFGRKEYAAAEALFERSFRESKGYDAFGGMLISALRTGRYAVLTTALDSVILPAEYPASYLPLFITVGDAAWAEGNIDVARMVYARLKEADIAGAYTEAAVLRLSAMNSGRGELLPYFLSDAGDSARVTMLDTLILNSADTTINEYLKGKVLLRLGRYDEAFAILKQLQLSGIDPLLEAIRLNSAGRALFRLRRYEEAKASFWVSLNSVSTEVAQHEAGDWIERCDWFASHNLP